ncbi:MAG: VanZ family protein [Candidatus Nanoarchaeia archaeon]|nr:VanZ family protein [Candidatus Nanoarchaeia archaeon]MDD5358035.1 VanZ family protein [Candidatus Nanoarchaeia archaeon]MDD5588954.1 VanZ family protein [Candidatus Nanoarchaeia archaeon]
MLKKILEWFEKNKIVSAVLLLINLGVIIYFSSTPGGAISFGSVWPSIFYHFTVFAGFAALFLMVISTKKLKLKYIIITILVSLMIAISDEIHQSFVPLRTSGIGDVLVDLAGISSSMIIYFLIKKLGK